MPKVVQLQDFHQRWGHLTDFSGFCLPLWFKGIIPEALAVRNAAGIFDVSQMGRTIIRGRDSEKLLDRITTNDVASLRIGQGQYSLMCNPDGGIKDDLLVFHLRDEEYLTVYNAGNRSKDYDWIITNSRGLDAEVSDISDKVAMFAVQGPRARQIVQILSSTDVNCIPRFGCAWTELVGIRALISRTGYTGEDGFEILVWDSPIDDPVNARTLWDELLQVGKTNGLEPCGLGARDLLRLEAGLCLYGNDMDESTNPYEAKLGFVVKLQKDFIGKEKLQEIKKNGAQKTRIGLTTTRRVIPRRGFSIISNERTVGTVTSGTLSPLLDTGIAMGYVDGQFAQEGSFLEIRVRDRSERAKIVRPPFYDRNAYGFFRKNQVQSLGTS